jgi:uncharacterized Zn finger protein (UPF0148 family)
MLPDRGFSGICGRISIQAHCRQVAGNLLARVLYDNALRAGHTGTGGAVGARGFDRWSWGVAMNAETEHCPRCGATVGRYDRFCARCGADLRAVAATTTTIERRSEQRVTEARSEPSAELLNLAEQLPVGTINLDLDEALSGAFGGVSAQNVEAVLEGALAAKLPSQARDAAGALATQLVKLLQTRADATGSSLPEVLQELAGSQAILQVEVSADDGERRLSMNMTSRSTTEFTGGSGRRLPTGIPRSGCRFTVLRLVGLFGAVGCGAIYLLLSR